MMSSRVVPLSRPAAETMLFTNNHFDVAHLLLGTNHSSERLAQRTVLRTISGLWSQRPREAWPRVAAAAHSLSRRCRAARRAISDRRVEGWAESQLVPVHGAAHFVTMVTLRMSAEITRGVTTYRQLLDHRSGADYSARPVRLNKSIVTR